MGSATAELLADEADGADEGAGGKVVNLDDAFAAYVEGEREARAVKRRCDKGSARRQGDGAVKACRGDTLAAVDPVEDGQ